ncbi:MAG: hypothetical protein GY702_27730 [Desulfobulbaceae bacterium]|nr:hypothetical protein [Desulfobulbaceae bacterium]
MNIPDKLTPFKNLHVNVAGKPLSSPPVQKGTVTPTQFPQSIDKVMPLDKIVISPEGKAKVEGVSSEDQSRSAMQELAGNGREVTEGEESSEIEAIEKMIEELEEQLRELMQQLAKLKTKDDEASLAQQNTLEAQIAALNSQIISLVGMKMEMLQQGKE